MQGWFKQCANLRKIEGIENLNTERVTDMSSMFEECAELKSIDLSHFDTKNVTTMEKCSMVLVLPIMIFHL